MPPARTRRSGLSLVLTLACAAPLSAASPFPAKPDKAEKTAAAPAPAKPAPAATGKAAAPAKPAQAKALAGPAEKPRKVREIPGELVEYKTVDGWTIKGQYLPAVEKNRTYILLHEAGGSKQNWYYFTKKMKLRGIGFLALDLRGHGLSQSAPEGQESYWRKFKVSKDNNDWDNMREDISSAVTYLKTRDVDPATVGLIGAAVGGSVAIRYAALHTEVPLVVLLSPSANHQNVPTINALRAYKGRPLLMVVGEDDERSAKQFPILFRIAQMAAGADHVFQLRVPKGHGTRTLVFNKGVMDALLDWLDMPAQAPNYESPTSTATAEGAAPGEGFAAPGGFPEAGAPPRKSALPKDGLPTDEQLDKEYGDAPQGEQ